MRRYRGRYGHGHHFPAIGFDDLYRYAALQRLGPRRSFFWNNYPHPIFWPNQNYFMVPGPYGYTPMRRGDMLIGGDSGYMWPMGGHQFQYHFEMDGD